MSKPVKKVNDTKKLIRLAEIKSIIKPLEKEAKEIQEEIFSMKGFPVLVSTEYGDLKFETRSNFEVPDNHNLISKSSITKEIFINTAKISVSSIKTIIGVPQFEKLVDDGVIVEKDPSRFYKLVEPKK